jgi:hypothetical protein
MTLVAGANNRPRPSPLSRIWAGLALLGLIVGMVAVAGKASHAVSCERHKGAFGADFSSDFDINSTDCRISSIKDSPVIRFMGATPYVSIHWPAK